MMPGTPRTTADVVVVGAGLAGLHTAARLAEHGHDVVLVDRRSTLSAAIRTTGIFVRKTLDDFQLPPEHLGPGIRTVLLYPPSLRRPVTLRSPRDEFRLGDMGPLYEALARRATAAGVRLLLGTRYVGSVGRARHLLGPDGPLDVTSRFVVGADGARSRVANDLGLDKNRHLLVGAEEVFPVTPGPEPAFHCVIDPRLAPGYLAWVVNDGEHAHVGLAGYHQRFPGGLRATLDRFVRIAPGLDATDRPGGVERRGGPIPVGGVLRRIACPDGLLVGDAAGAVSPLTAGGLDPCLRLSEHAADVLHTALQTGTQEALRHYDGASLRARFRGRLALRHGLSLVRSPAMATAAFVMARTPPGRAVARSVLFGDRSFPSDLTPAAAATTRLRPATGWRRMGVASETVSITFLRMTHPDDAAARLLGEYFDERIDIWEGEGRYRPSPADFSRGVLVVVVVDGEPAGVGGIRPIPDGDRTSFEIKHLYTRPSARGRGLARALLADLESQAIKRGATDLVLDTNTSLDAAGALYTRSGYALTDPFNDNPNADAWYRKTVAP